MPIILPLDAGGKKGKNIRSMLLFNSHEWICWKCSALEIWEHAVFVLQRATAPTKNTACGNRICDHVIVRPFSVLQIFYKISVHVSLCVSVFVCVCGIRGFFHLASSDWQKKTPVGTHELTCCIFMPHISWLRTTSREASQAWPMLGELGRRGRGGDPCGLQKRRPAMNPEDLIRGPVTSLVQSSEKSCPLAWCHTSDVNLHHSDSVICPKL